MMKIFVIWKVCIGIGFSKSWLWKTTMPSGEKRIFIVDICVLENDGKKAVSVIVGPVAINAGIINKGVVK